MLEDRRVSIRKIAADIGVSFGSVQSVMHDVLGIRRVEVRLVPNAPAHTSHLVHDYLTKNNVNTVPQAPYPPDMAPCDFFLFPRLKLPLRGKRFEAIEAIKENSQKELKAIPKSAYEKCFEDWK